MSSERDTTCVLLLLACNSIANTTLCSTELNHVAIQLPVCLGGAICPALTIADCYTLAGPACVYCVALACCTDFAHTIMQTSRIIDPASRCTGSLPLVASLLQPARSALPCSIHLQPAQGFQRSMRHQTASLPRMQPDRADVQVRSTPDSTASSAVPAVAQRPTRFSRYGITGMQRTQCGFSL